MLLHLAVRSPYSDSVGIHSRDFVCFHDTYQKYVHLFNRKDSSQMYLNKTLPNAALIDNDAVPGLGLNRHFPFGLRLESL